jgi:hypothetical protein
MFLVKTCPINTRGPHGILQRGISRAGLGFWECLLDAGVASEHTAIDSALLPCPAKLSPESVPEQVFIAEAPSATEVPARRLTQRVMDAREAIGVDFDAQGRRRVAESGKEPMPRVG